MASISRFGGDLTLLYTETKKKALNSTGKHEAIPALSHLDRKLRIQKDRLVTWGLEWTDQDKGPGGDIDASVAQAGMTETVTSVLGNIQEVLEQAEKIKSAIFTWPASEKAPLSTNVQARYEDLLLDLSTSIDILYEISTSRRALATGSHPTFSSDRYQHEYAPGTIISESKPEKQPFQFPSFTSSELTLVNPSFSRPNLSPYAGLPAILDPQALQLPAEAPPPYESYGVPSATRMIGQLVRSKVPESVQAVLKGTSPEAYVLVEYANYDPLYHETGVPPPLQRLEGLAAALAQAQSRRQRSLFLLGYFEDPHQPRIGLVYDFSGAIHGGSHLEQLVPVSLLSLVQTANKGSKPADIVNATPFLEDRFRVALNVAENVRDLHAEGFSHGNLNSGSVVFFRQGENPHLRRGELHRPTLSAFDMFSRSRIERGSTAPSFNITRHPHDHDGNFDNVKAVQYDLYGLALLLLEIGLWVPLHDLYKAKYSLKDFKLRIEKIWIPRLASKCGSLYMRAVQTCLRLSDEPELSKIDPEKIYGSVIRRLQRCCYLDEDEPIVLGSDMMSPQDQMAMFRAAATEKRRQTPSVWSSSGPVTSSALSMTSASTFRDETDQIASLPSIATTMAQSLENANPLSLDEQSSMLRTTPPRTTIHHTDSAEGDISPTKASLTPFREYRRKVILLQRRWRECCRRFTEEKRRPSAPGDSASQSVQHHSHRLERRISTSDAHIRRSSDTVSKRCQIFPIRLPQPALDDWHSHLGLRLSRILERVLKDSTESSSIDLVGFGYDSFSAKPTILVTCASTARVKAALKRKFTYDRSMFDLKVRKGCVSLARGKNAVKDKLARRASGGGEDSDDGESDGTAPLNPFFQKRPLCGASIGAFLPNYGHLDPVSYGGIIVVEQDGQMQQYGMSVHHMLDPPDSDDNDEQESPSSGSDARSGASRSSSNYDSDSDEPNTDSSEGSDDDVDDGGYISSEFESDISDDEQSRPESNRSEHGDKPGVKANSSPFIQVTQPAFQDAWDQDLHADDALLEDLDEDHLSSFKFGKIHASSGLRRVLRNGMRHEIDWALITLDPPRLSPYNLIQGGRRYCNSNSSTTNSRTAALESHLEQSPSTIDNSTNDQDSHPVDIVPLTQLANLQVHCFGRTSGLSSGTINAQMSFVKIRGRRTFSSSWSVIGGFGVGGDSGAWVVDNKTGRVCGHVLAEGERIAYICSMQLLLEDIKSTLGASGVSLPGSVSVGSGAGIDGVMPDRGMEKEKEREKEQMRRYEDDENLSAAVEELSAEKSLGYTMTTTKSFPSSALGTLTTAVERLGLASSSSPPSYSSSTSTSIEKGRMRQQQRESGSASVKRSRFASSSSTSSSGTVRTVAARNKDECIRGGRGRGGGGGAKTVGSMGKQQQQQQAAVVRT